MRLFIRQLRPALIVLAVFTLVLGVAYPLLMPRSGRSRSTTRPTAR